MCDILKFMNNKLKNEQNRILKRRLSGLFSAVLVLCTVIFVGILSAPTINAAPNDWPVPPDIDCEYYCLMDADTGEILLESNSNEQCYPASVTKLMTALIVAEKCNMSDTLTVSSNAVNSIKYGDANAALKAGEEFTVLDALNIMLIKSANDMAYALGEHVGGTVANFANMMNQKAEELGCTNTHFSNASGLTDVYHYTTAADMAKICRAVIDNPIIMNAISYTKTYSVEPTNKTDEKRYYRISHSMLAGRDYAYDYCIGGKTGYTDAAGHTLATFAQKDGMRLIMVVFRSTDAQRYIDTTAMFNYVFDNFKKVILSEVDSFGNLATSTMLGDFGVKGTALNNSSALTISLPESTYLVVPNNIDYSKLTKIITYENNNAKVYFNYGNHLISSFDLDINVDTGSVDLKGLPLLSGVDKDLDFEAFLNSDHYIAINTWLFVATCAGIVLAIIIIIILINNHIKQKEIYTAKKRRRRR